MKKTAGHGKYRIWLIPALIIGFNCLAFIIVLAISLNKGKKSSPVADGSVSEDTIIEESGDPYGEPEREDEGSAESAVESDAVLSDSFYEEDPIDDRAYSSGYVLLLTSSEADLMIRILDNTGNPASGMEWTARVAKLSESTADPEIESSEPESYEEEFEADDEDGDGVIYLDEMAPGDYNVVVDNGSGIVETSSINIKPKIKYKESSGIRSIVLQESQIDAKVEDTAPDPVEKEAEAESEGEGTESSADINLPQGTLGIDVSKYNKEIDWTRVKASGIDFVIIRAGYRGSSSGVLVEDPYFRQNLAGAKAAGLRIGVYFFTQAINADEAREEAQAVASLVNSSDLSLPVFLDVESSGNSNGGRADPLDTISRTEIVRTFCETAESLGYRAGVYANKTWMNKRLDMSALTPYTKWLAQYRAAGPTYDGDYSIWQYTSSGAVDGISGRVDLDILVK